MAGENAKVLSYGDVLLRRSDVRLLEGAHYLNDHIIEFFFSFLASSFSSDSVLLVGPSLTFWLMYCPDSDSLRAAIAPLRLHHRHHILFAVNNNDDVEEAGGGSHWSLLTFDSRSNVFYHYDSLEGMNRRHAEYLVSIVKPFLGSDASSVNFVEASSPQQENGYDCGVYVMAIAQVLCKAFHGDVNVAQDKEIVNVLQEGVTADSVRKMRETTLELIYSLSRS